jgi:DNA-binding CsgD family transcriptional regulator
MDPATLLPTREVIENGLPATAQVRLGEIELREPDVNKFAALARARRPAASLSEATAGDLDRSLRHRELRRPSGFEDELRVVFPGVMGVWGALTLLREATRPHFTPAEVDFVASLAGVLADGLRRAMLLGDAAPLGDTAPVGGTAAADGDPGVLVLAVDTVASCETYTVEMANRAGDRWLDELESGDRPSGHLPPVIRAVADRTRQLASDDGIADAGIARARVRTAAGSWVVVRGSILGDGPGSRVVVLLEAARPSELAPLIAEAHGFTERERLVTELVAQGFSTNEIGGLLHLSAYTVQDHLKSIFDKFGASSRGELIARLFFDRSAPRLSSSTDPS